MVPALDALVSRWTPLHTAMVAGGYGTVAASIDPYRPRLLGCPVHAATGGWCPGCGSTRAVHELLHGDLAATMAAHPLVIPAVVLLGSLWLAAVVRQVRPTARSFTATDLPVPVVAAIGVAFVGLTIARNAVGLWVPPDQPA